MNPSPCTGDRGAAAGFTYRRCLWQSTVQRRSGTKVRRRYLARAGDPTSPICAGPRVVTYLTKGELRILRQSRQSRIAHCRVDLKFIGSGEDLCVEKSSRTLYSVLRDMKSARRQDHLDSTYLIEHSRRGKLPSIDDKHESMHDEIKTNRPHTKGCEEKKKGTRP